MMMGSPVAVTEKTSIEIAEEPAGDAKIIRFETESESYITTDGQSASLSWNKAAIWGLRPGFHYCQTVAGLLMWGALSLTRGHFCRLQLHPALASAVFFRVRIPWDS
jgi:hypothetical protein